MTAERLTQIGFQYSNIYELRLYRLSYAILSFFLAKSLTWQGFQPSRSIKMSALSQDADRARVSVIARADSA
jgi:hypothetical protein